MLYRFSGKLVDGQPFSARIEAPNAVDAVAQGGKLLASKDVGASDVGDIHVSRMKGKDSLYIGKARAPKAATAPAATTAQTTGQAKRK